MTQIKFEGMGLFNTEAVWIHPQRIEKTYEIIYVTCGTVFLYEGDTEFELNKGDLVVLKPKVKHGGSAQSQGRTSFFWLHFSGEYPEALCGVLRNFLNGGMFRELIHYDNVPRRDTDALRIITEHILLSIKTGHDNVHKSKLASEVNEWVRINVKAGLTNTIVAENFRLNPEYISRIIKREYGITLKKLTDKMLCEKFENLLLNTNYSIKEISSILAFGEDLSSCVNFFKYHKKISPSEFRRQYSEIHMNLK